MGELAQVWAPPERAPSIDEMIAAMDERVAGLPDAKAQLAVLLHRHAMAGINQRDVKLPNVLVIGESGGGKTHTVNAACEVAGLPFIEVNATQFSEVGFAGLDVSQMLAGFWGPRWCPPPAKRQAIIPLAERFGVVVIDEIDKWAFHPNLKERQPQRVLQAELLRFVEGEVARVREKDSEMGTPFDTTHLLFIGTGAFQSLGQMVDPTDPQAYTKADSSHIEKYGFLTELAGRFSTIIGLPRLDSNAMARILREQVWPSYVQQMEDDGLEVLVEDAALRRIGDIAIQKYTGARGLIPELERLLRHAWRQARPGGVVRLSLDDVDAGRAVYLDRVAA